MPRSTLYWVEGYGGGLVSSVQGPDKREERHTAEAVTCTTRSRAPIWVRKRGTGGGFQLRVQPLLRVQPALDLPPSPRENALDAAVEAGELALPAGWSSAVRARFGLRTPKLIHQIPAVSRYASVTQLTTAAGLGAYSSSRLMVPTQPAFQLPEELAKGRVAAVRGKVAARVLLLQSEK